MELQFVMLYAAVFGFVIIQNVAGERVVTIKLNDNVTTDLQSYVSDLHVAISAAQYAANVSSHMVTDLIDKLQKNQVACKCENDNRVSGNRDGREFEKSDYQKTSSTKAHKLYTRPLKWNDARKACKQEGGELATIDSTEEAQILAKLLEDSKDWNVETNVTDRAAFMGIHSHFDSNDWTTIRGDPILRSVQTTQEINNCAALTLQANLNAARCDAPHPYFCEIQAN